MLPADSHVHSEFSWDTGGPLSPSAAGTMRRTCARAVRIGLPVIIFTEHLDFSGWRAAPEDFAEHERRLIDRDGLMQPPPLDVDGYPTSPQRCRPGVAAPRPPAPRRGRPDPAAAPRRRRLSQLPRALSTRVPRPPRPHRGRVRPASP